MKFRQVRLQGSPAEIGLQHGRALADEIARALVFYRGIFGLDDSELLQQGERYARIIREFSPDLATEIESVAQGCSQDPRLIYALNSRSEIYNDASVAECTAVYDIASRTLAQNWDWSEHLLPLVVDMRIERPDGHVIRMLTEPGIIGKIGMNSAGLGTCLNILRASGPMEGLPVHVLLRALVDCGSLGQARAVLDDQCGGKASHVLIADDLGGCISTEFAGRSAFDIQPSNGVLLHTNHYLADDSLNDVDLFPFTFDRYEQADRMLMADSSPDGIQRLLTDTSRAERSICKPWTMSESPGFDRVGTVFTVIMDLPQRHMSLRPGHEPGQSFYSIGLD